MADLSRCFLHNLGQAEAALLAEFQGRVPGIIAKVREASAEAKEQARLSIWGVDLEAKTDASDIILLKFLRAEELNLDKAAERLVQTLVFRADCRIDDLVRAELPEHFRGHDFITGPDSEGRPVLISHFGNMDLEKVFGDVEAFVRYRAKLMEQAMLKLSFKRGEPEDLTQIHDYSGVPLIFQTSEVKGGVAAVSKVFGEHYPETKGKAIFVNFPSAFSSLFKAFSVFIPERTRKKFTILGDSDQASLFEHVPPEVVPEVLGGMAKTPPSGLTSPCKVVDVRPRTVEDVVLAEVSGPASILWEVRVCYAEASYEVVFVPAAGEEEVVRRSDPEAYLQSTDGVVGGEYSAKAAGALHCRLNNECAWFKWRLCVCRGEVKR